MKKFAIAQFVSLCKTIEGLMTAAAKSARVGPVVPFCDMIRLAAEQKYKQILLYYKVFFDNKKNYFYLFARRIC